MVTPEELVNRVIPCWCIRGAWSTGHPGAAHPSARAWRSHDLHCLTWPLLSQVQRFVSVIALTRLPARRIRVRESWPHAQPGPRSPRVGQPLGAAVCAGEHGDGAVLCRIDDEAAGGSGRPSGVAAQVVVDHHPAKRLLVAHVDRGQRLLCSGDSGAYRGMRGG